VDLARRVISLTNSASKIEFIPYEKAYGHAFDDLARRVPRLDKIRAVISFKPRLNLDQIIRSVVEYQTR
jgi:UDP-glucose 4-epimerase